MIFLFKILFSLELFLIALKLPNYKIPLLSNYGRYCSMYLYLFHLLTGALIYGFISLGSLEDYLLPFIVLIISIGISILMYYIIALIYNKLKRKQAS